MPIEQDAQEFGRHIKQGDWRLGLLRQSVEPGEGTGRPSRDWRRSARAIRHCGAMYFVGLDLAWGEKKTTGIAALDDEGSLVHIGAARGDPTIHAQLDEWVGGSCLG